MSEEFESNPDKDRFINCKVCPRRFVTKIGFKIHLINMHKESDKKVEELPRNKEEIAFQQNTELEEKYPECSLSFESKIGLQVHTSNDHNKLTTYLCSDCKKSFRYRKRFKKHIQNEHKGSKTGPSKTVVPSKTVCPDCHKYYGSKTSLQMHINVVHWKLTPHQCHECKKFKYRTQQDRLRTSPATNTSTARPEPSVTYQPGQSVVSTVTYIYNLKYCLTFALYFDLKSVIFWKAFHQIS